VQPPSWWWLVPLAGVGLAGTVVGSRSAKKGVMVRLPYVTALAGVVFVGLHQGASVLHPSCRTSAPCSLDLPRSAVIEGWIATEPVDRSGRRRFDLQVAAFREGDQWQRLEGRIRVWAHDLGEGWHEGSCLRARLRLRRPRNFNNPGAFDYVRYLRRDGITVTGSIWDGASIEQCERRLSPSYEVVVASRRRIALAIDASVSAGPAGVIRALVIGDRSGLSKSLRADYARAGVGHILSISGLHLAVVAGAVFAVLRLLAAQSEIVLARGLAPRLAALGALPVTLAYGVLAGARAPTLRAAVMISVYLTAVICDRRSEVLRSLALAALVIVSCWPGAAFDLSFWFSFLAVVSIALGTRRLQAYWRRSPTISVPASVATISRRGQGLGGRGSWSGEALSRRCGRWALMSVVTSLSAALGTAPLSAFYFNMVSFAGPFANLFAVPLFSAAVVAALLGAMISLVEPVWAAMPFWIAGALVEVGGSFVVAVAALPGAAVRTVTPTLLELSIAYAALSCIFLSGRHRLFLVAVVALVAGCDGLYWARERYARPTLRVTFLDVGQGDASVVEFPGSAVLVVDGGGFEGSDFDLGKAVVAPFLWSRKIARVDYVAMSHAEIDHAGGLPFLVTEFRPREFWWNGRPGKGETLSRLRAALDEGRVLTREMSRDTPPWTVGRVRIDVLHPPAGYARSVSANDASLVLRLQWGATTVLFTGDIEGRGEEHLVQLGAPAIRSSIVKVPHHGSLTSSGERFIEAVQPDVAVVSVGAANRYASPHPQVLARYQARGVCVRRTDEHGAIILRGTPSGYRIDLPCRD
jgi:competence protein ComEC